MMPMPTIETAAPAISHRSGACLPKSASQTTDTTT